MARVENEKWEKHRNEKLKKELEKTVSKQENENQHFHKKMKCMIVQKYKNKIKETDNSQKCELNEFHRPLRSALKNVPYSNK